ncbi:MAG: glycosyltransferase [Candidatus Pedobacter colombiensis]|uniref:Glycosyltransferase n=1 Tax=Candidatus Pedobacter colombiensis TaxID=3121371 RepID=A0AAJ5W8T0_9SPHI|nr:glycosyltransferase [Pedobacter sp.]WEK19700.1 MAG: glycosyltransferase [Pedobacter sp.]
MNTLALCIPAYNAEEYLPRLLTSANHQQIPFDEILVYDDCSTDKTAEIAAQYGAKVISGTINKGCSFGKNALAKHTTCTWIHFHDADDDLLPNFSTKVHQWINDYGNNYEVLLLNFKYIDAASGELLGSANYDIKALQEDPLKYAIKTKIVNFGVYKREAFLNAGGFDLDPDVLYNEDNALHQQLAKHGLKFDYLPELTCINYRNHNSMSQANRLKCARANYHVLKKTAISHGSIYPRLLSDQLYNCIAILASVEDWIYVKKALQLCKALGHSHSTNGNKSFNFLTRIHPYLAVWLREKMIRVFKPQLRK